MPMERADNALQNRGMIVPERGAAMADWQRFSIDLREQCFEHDEGGDELGGHFIRIFRSGAAHYQGSIILAAI
jgi:hypothetical protein